MKDMSAILCFDPCIGIWFMNQTVSDHEDIPYRTNV